MCSLPVKDCPNAKKVQCYETNKFIFNAVVSVKISFLETKLNLEIKVLYVNMCKIVQSNKSSD